LVYRVTHAGQLTKGGLAHEAGALTCAYCVAACDTRYVRRRRAKFLVRARRVASHSYGCHTPHSKAGAPACAYRVAARDTRARERRRVSRRPTPGAPHATAVAVARRTAKREHPRARIAAQLATPVLVNTGARAASLRLAQCTTQLWLLHSAQKSGSTRVRVACRSLRYPCSQAQACGPSAHAWRTARHSYGRCTPHCPAGAPACEYYVAACDTLVGKRKLVEHEGTAYRRGNPKADVAEFSPDSQAQLDTSPTTRRLLDAHIDHDNDRNRVPVRWMVPWQGLRSVV